MENNEYEKIISNEPEKLAEIKNINNLVDEKYLDLYLIEYLLKDNIHTKEMDNRVCHSSKWIKFYLKYNVLKPLLNCYLKPLMEVVDGKLLLDSLLEKLNTSEKIELYNNLKENSYWELHDHEKEIIDLYKKYSIDLEQIFINGPSILNSKVSLKKKNTDLINEFCEVFKDTNSHILSAYLHELKRKLSISNKRTETDIKKLIEYKRRYPNFVLQVSNNSEGEYNSELKTITMSPKREGVLTHELSHMMFKEFDNDDILNEYEKLRKEIICDETKKKINIYLKTFHDHFSNMTKYFEALYYNEIKKKYGSYNEYIKAVCYDIYKHQPEIISATNDSFYFYVNADNILDIATELLIIEKEEFINSYIRNYYTEELMLENLLDALFKGDICDGKFDIICFSGHSGIDFEEFDNLSLDECLADYDAIKNSKKNKKLISDLEYLVGSDLINLLDNYLEKNRGTKYGI